MLAVPLDPARPSAPAALYGAAAFHALAREEHAGRRPKRLLEPGLATWVRFRGRLGVADLLRLVLEDAAVTQPNPFASRAVLGERGTADELSDALVDAWMAELPRLDLDATPAAYVTAQAKLLNVPVWASPAKLPTLEPHHRVLELPGTGGQLAFAVAQAQEIHLHDVFTIACATWQEVALAGIIAVECKASAMRIVLEAASEGGKPLDKALEGKESFTHVLGLGPTSGGHLEREWLHLQFSSADLVLV